MKKLINNVINENLSIKNNSEDFLSIVEREQQNLFSYINPEKGIAKNKALLDNVFIIFICINTKVPLFICGKPGCSKSLSVQMIYKIMSGKNSEISLFREYPRIVMNTYQGSETSTSKGIEEIFRKARNVYKNKEKNQSELNEIVSVIYFDEMGLAEISPNNPLKVIHSELEYQEDKYQPAFIGISNWKLDASKMNRGVFLAIPEADRSDLIETAMVIAESFEESLRVKHRKIFESLACSYSEYKYFLSMTNPEIKEFHGTRDFYYLIKTTAKYIIGQNFNDEYEAAIRSIERNFGGKEISIQKIKEEFNKFINKPSSSKDQYDVKNCIKENILDDTSRYLLLISKPSLSSFILEIILNEIFHENKKHTFFFGSKFENDKLYESYSAKILHKVQSFMAEEKIVIFMNLDSIYPSLYDLFNQSFSLIGNKKFCRIALGYSNSVNAFVNEKFKCIVIVEQNSIDQQMPPFLNRFEKHIISIEYLLNQNEINLAKEIYTNLKDLITVDDKNTNIELDTEKLFFNCNLEEIEGLICNIKMKEKLLNGKKDIIKNVLEKIVPTFPQDIITLGNISYLKTRNKEFYNMIIEIYEKNKIQNISEFFDNITNHYNIIYTFSSHLEVIEYGNNVDMNKNNNIIKEFSIKGINSEEKLQREISEFLSSDKLKFCILRFKPADCKHLNHIKFFIESLEKTENFTNKYFVFLIHVKRVFINVENNNNIIINNSELVSHLSGWKQIFIDDINSKNKNMIEILKINLENLLDQNKKEEKFVDFDRVIRENIYNCVSLIKYEIKNKNEFIEKKENTEDYFINLTYKLLQKETILKKITEIIRTEILKKNDIIYYEFFNQLKKVYENFDTEISEIFKKFLVANFFEFLSNFIVSAELDNFLSPAALENFAEQHPKINEFIIEKYISNFNFQKRRIAREAEANKIEIIYGTKLPLIEGCYKNILRHFENYILEYKENEKKVREEIDCDNKEIVVEKYNKSKENILYQCFTLLDKINNDEYLNIFIADKENTVLIKVFLDDFYKFYLKNNKIEEYKISETIISLLIEKELENHDKKDISFAINAIIFLQAFNEIIVNLLNIFLDYWYFFNKTVEIYVKNEGKIEKTTNLVDEMKQIINSGKIEFETSERNPKILHPINKTFYLIFESILKIITKYFTTFNYENLDASNYLSKINEIIIKAKQIDSDLFLFSPELSVLKLINNVSELLVVEQKNLKDFCILLIEDQNYIYNKNYDGLINNLQKEYKYINNYQNKKGYSSCLLNFFIFKRSQYDNPKYRALIFKLALSNVVVLNNSFQRILHMFLIIDLNPPVNVQNIKDLNENDELEFLEFSQNENDLLDSILNEKNNTEFINEHLLYHFEGVLEKFILGLRDINETDERIILNKRLIDNFGKSLDYLIDIYYRIDKKKNGDLYIWDKKIYYEEIGKIYCIAYCRIFLKYYVNSHYSMSSEELQIQENIIKLEEINSKLARDNPVITVIKFYILKLIRNKYDNYQLFLEFDFKKHYMKWCLDINLEQNVNKLNLSKYFLISKNVYKFIKNKEIKEKEIYFESNILDLYDFYCNYYLFYIFNDVQLLKSRTFDSIKQKINKINLSSINYHKLFNIFFEENMFKESVETIINKKKFDIFEIFLYCFKFVLLSAFDVREKGNNFYYNLFSNNLSNIISLSFIPGYRNLNREKISYFLIKKFFNEERIGRGNEEYDYSPGAYMCSCGTFYQILDCSFPDGIGNCSECKKEIGGEDHSMLKQNNDDVEIIRNYKDEEEREFIELKSGHRRILVDENEKNCLIGTYFRGTPFYYQMFSDLEKDIVNQLGQVGIINIDKKIIEACNEVDNISIVTYRLLNLIYASYIYFSSILGLINEEDKKQSKYIGCGDFNYSNLFELIVFYWKLLKNDLKLKGVEEIQIFLNLIFPELKKEFSNCGKMKEIKDRNEFEKKIDKIVLDNIKNYEKLSQEYLSVNQQFYNDSGTSCKSLIEEILSPDKYKFNEFPFLQYFMYSEIPNNEKFTKDFDSFKDKNNYPIIKTFILKEDEIKKLKYLKSINPFSNEMIDKFSYIYTRREAQNIKINKALKDLSGKDEIYEKKLNKMYKEFETAMNTLKKDNRKFECRPLMQPKEITNEDSLSYILCDSGEVENGMYLASAYYNFILWQNEILKDIRNGIQPNSKLFYLRKQISEEILINKANNSKILTNDFGNNNDDLNNLFDIVQDYSHRDCFRGSEIKYNNYNQIEYDYNKIEEELGVKLLTGKKSFVPKGYKFIIYKYEEFLGENSSIFGDFAREYHQIELDLNMKKKISEYISSEDTKVNNNKFLENLKKIIQFLKNNKYKFNEPFCKTIERFPPLLNLNEFFKQFFDNNKEFTINHLLEIYNYFEESIVDDIFENVDKDYKDKIGEKKIQDIKLFFEHFNPKIVTKKLLAEALRKYISRFLCGLRMDVEYAPELKLLEQLGRPELWPLNLENESDKILEELIDLSNRLNIYFREAVEFYNLIKDNRNRIEGKQPDIVIRPNRRRRRN